MPEKLSNAVIEKMYALYADTDMSLKEIAAELGVSLSSVATYTRLKFTNKNERKQRGVKISVSKAIGRERIDYTKVAKAVELMKTTDLSVMDIAEITHMTGRSMRRYVYPVLGKEFVNTRYKRLRDTFFKKNSGKNNNLYKVGYIFTKDGRGKQYKSLLKPAWYTGKGFIKGAYVREHVINVCIGLHLSELPKDLVVHHCDLNTLNNDFSNLIVLPNGLHTSLHQTFLKESATTISKESTLKWLEEARGYTWSKWKEEHPDAIKPYIHDIVCSAQECAAAASNCSGLSVA